MHSRPPRLPSHVLATLALLLPISVAGCVEIGDLSQAVETSPPEATNRTPEQLLAELQTAQHEANDTAELLTTSSSKFRRDLLRKYVDTGLEAADRLLAHTDAEQLQAQVAREAKAQLLGRALENGWDGYEDQLAAFHTQLKKEYPRGKEMALADALLLSRKHIRSGADFDETMTALKTHAATFSSYPTGPALFHRYTKRLISEQRPSEARQCCEVAIGLFGDSSQTAPLRQLLSRIAQQQQTSQAKQAQVSQIKARLGGHDDGYFVLFLRPKELRNGSLVDYVVAAGLQEAIRYATNIREGWVWQLVAHYPKTSNGKTKAHAQCKKLIKQNTRTGPIVPF